MVSNSLRSFLFFAMVFSSIAFQMSTWNTVGTPQLQSRSCLNSEVCSFRTRVGIRLRGKSLILMAKKEKEEKGGKGKKSKGDDAPAEDFPAADREVKLGKMDTDVKGVDIKSILKSVEEKMKKTLESTKGALAAIRTGRPSPNILDKVMVSYYGVETPLPQIASVQVASASTIVVEPFDKKLMKDVERGIMMADLGMTPNNDGTVIRLNVPSLTMETRLKYIKQAKGVAEEGKVALRNIRRTGVDAVKKLEKDKVASEDASASAQDEIQKLTDRNTKDLDTLADAKEKELAKV